MEVSTPMTDEIIIQRVIDQVARVDKGKGPLHSGDELRGVIAEEVDEVKTELHKGKGKVTSRCLGELVDIMAACVRGCRLWNTVHVDIVVDDPAEDIHDDSAGDFEPATCFGFKFKMHDVVDDGGQEGVVVGLLHSDLGNEYRVLFDDEVFVVAEDGLSRAAGMFRWKQR